MPEAPPPLRAPDAAPLRTEDFDYALPERLIAAGDFRVVRRMFSQLPVRPGAFTAEDINRYVAALAAPGALTAALNYYRANFRSDGVALAMSARIASSDSGSTLVYSAGALPGEATSSS